MCLQERRNKSSFHQEQVILTQELMGTFHFMASAMFLQPTMPAVVQAREGTALHLCEEPHQPPRDLGTNHHIYPHNPPLHQQALLLLECFSYTTSFILPILWLGLLDYNSLLRVRLVLCPPLPVCLPSMLLNLSSQPLTAPRPHSWPFHFINAPSTTEAVEAIQVIPPACQSSSQPHPTLMPTLDLPGLNSREVSLLCALSVIQSVL